MISFRGEKCTAELWAAFFIYHHGADALADQVCEYDWKQMTKDERMEVDDLIVRCARKVKTFLELPELP